MASVAGTGPGLTQGAWSLIQVSLVGAGAQGLETSATVFPSMLTENWIGSGAANTGTGILRVASIAGSDLTYCTTALDPVSF